MSAKVTDKFEKKFKISLDKWLAWNNNTLHVKPNHFDDEFFITELLNPHGCRNNGRLMCVCMCVCYSWGSSYFL